MGLFLFPKFLQNNVDTLSQMHDTSPTQTKHTRNTDMKAFIIIDSLTKEIVAQRGTKPSADKWASKLNDGLKGRYVVSKV